MIVNLIVKKVSIRDVKAQKPLRSLRLCVKFKKEIV